MVGLGMMMFEAGPAHAWGMSADDWIKAVAVLVGGAWALMNFVRGRTYRKRLDVELPGELGERLGVRIFSGECRAKNVGSSEIAFVRQGTGVTIFSLWLRKYSDGSWGIEEEVVDATRLIEKDAWIEPGETFSKPYIVALPTAAGEFVGVRTQVMINNGKTIWTVSKITDLPKPKKEEKSDA